MTNEQLNELYLKYLQREPSVSDIRAHINKSFANFERELSNCAEYKNLGTAAKPSSPNTKKENLNGKIAILLSGHIRKNPVTKSLLKHFSSYDYDVFIHTWDNIGLKGKETNVNDIVQESAVLKEVNAIPNVKKLQIENNKKYVNSLESTDIEYFNFSSDEPFIKSQLYSILRSHELMEEYQRETNQQYVMVIKLRFDAEIHKAKFDLQLINEINSHDIIFTSDIECHHHEGQGDNDSAAGCMICNRMYYKYHLKEVHNFDHANIICDFYAYGSEKVMKTYCSMYKEYDRICKSFVESNKKQYKKNPAYVFKCGDVYKIRDNECNCNLKIEGANNRRSHIQSLFYYQSSAPERILQTLLKDYMCLKSTHMTAKTVR